jgi:hypothetical protein
MSEVEADDQEAVRAYCKFGQALRDVEAHRQTLTEQMSKSFVGPLKTFIDGPLGEVKESKKVRKLKHCTIASDQCAVFFPPRAGLAASTR